MTGAADGSSSFAVKVRPRRAEAPSTSKNVPETALFASVTGLAPGRRRAPDQFTDPTSATSSNAWMASRSRRAE